MIYDYKCPVCASRREVVKPLAEIDREEQCPRCASPMLRQITAPAVLGDLPGYDCPITGKWIEGRRAHEENLRKHGCRVLEPGESAGVRTRMREGEEALDRAVEETVGREIDAMPHEKRQELETALSHGVDLTVSRSTVTARS